MITTSQFIGYYKISQDSNTVEILESYITTFEKQYLIDLLGYELYLLFRADLVNEVPQSARFTAIYNELEYTDGVDTFYPIGFRRSKFDDNRTEIEPTHSYGMIDMLKGFIFFEFVNEYGLQVSQTGVVENVNENAEVSAGAKRVGLIETKYNRAVNSFKVIRRYMIDNPDIYPEYAGIEKETSYWGGAF